MLNLPGYQILEQIHDSHKSRVYKGYRVKDHQPVILKLLKQDYPTQKDLNRYQQEYDILSSLNIDSVIKAYALESYQNTLVTVLEDFDGISLSDILADHKIHLREFLCLSIKMIEAVGQIHAAQIIHKDINPSNIVWNPETNEIKIIDFGISSRFSNGVNPSQSANLLEGTMLYMSPEQTGRMNRSVDYRTDFYSLGMTFYEMLTGQLPFQLTELTDPMELVHCHIAKQPVPPHKQNPEIPPVVSAMILKLLAKNAEERYQSAWGIKADLKTCLNQLETQGTISEFAIATQDISEQFQLPQKLYGRDAEIETLLASFDRVTQGEKELVIISGDPGIGKSSLVQEIYQPISQKHGYLVTGKFTQVNQESENVAYTVIGQAFSGLIRQLLTESESKLNYYRTKLINSLGDEAPLLLDVIPELKLIFGQSSHLDSVMSDRIQAASESQLEQVLLEFIRLVCDPNHPIVLFLDDLHWVDRASLNLIKLIMLDEGIRYLLVIIAYQDLQILEASDLPIKTLGDILTNVQQANIPINQVKLNPLTYDHITELLVETLHQDSTSVRSLAGIVCWKTDGIPLLVHKFITKLYEDKFLKLELKSAITHLQPPSWTWDIEKIKPVEIVNLLISEIPVDPFNNLPESTQNVLRLAACLDDGFNLETLSLLSDRSIPETFEMIWPGIEAGLVLPQEGIESIKIDINHPNILFDRFQFSSNLFKEAALNSINSNNLHNQLNSQFKKILKKRDISIESVESVNQIFKVVEKLNLDQELIIDESDRGELATLNLTAGDQAKQNQDYDLAQEAFERGIKFLNPETSWERHYDVAIALYKNLAEIEVATHQLEAAETHLELLLDRLQSTLDKADVADRLIGQYCQTSKFDQAILLGQQALKWLGITLPTEPPAIQKEIQQTIQQCNKYLETRSLDRLIHQSAPMNVAKKMLIKLLTSLSMATRKTDRYLYDLLIVKSVNLSLTYGHIPESAYAYAAYGAILISLFGNQKMGYEFGKLAFKLSKKLNHPVQEFITYNLYANEILPWVQPISVSNSMNTQGFEMARTAEKLELGRDLLVNQCINYFYQGKFLAHLMTDLNKCLEINESSYNLWTNEAILASQIAIANLTGQTADKSTFANAQYNESDYLKYAQDQRDIAGVCLYKLYKMQILYLYEDYSQAIGLAQDIENIIDYIQGSIANFEYIFYYALILTALYPRYSQYHKKDCLIKLYNYQIELKKNVDHCPKNFRAKFLLIEAEIARITGKIVEAMNLYDYVIQLVQGHEYIQIRALTDELAAKFWLDQEKEQFAQLYMEKARACYQMWGAKRKVEDLEEKYSSLLPMNPEEKAKIIDRIKPSSTLYSPLNLNISRTTTYLSSNSEVALLDLGTVMKASQAISSEIILDNLLEKLMNILMENAGAQKGFLILENQEKFFIEAEGIMGYDLSADSSPDTTMIKVLQSVPIAEINPKSSPLPLAIVHYVLRTKKDYVWPDTTQISQESATSPEPTYNDDLFRQFSNDPYFQTHQPQSILCAPLMNKGNLDGIIYMENNLTTGAFTPDRLEMLHLLSSQAAISIQNSRYYTNMAALNQAYERFVPRQFLQFLKKKSIVDVQLGDNVEQEMSVLFSDIRGFTTLSESLTPEENFKFINSYLCSMEPAIVENNGFIDKYIGDAIMALFPGGADDAVNAAIAMLRRLSEYNDGRKRAGYVPIEIGIGINTGDLMLGTVGGNSRMDSTVISDAVNLASRLEDLTKVYGVSLLISHQTFLRLSNATHYKIRIIERLTVKGKSHPVAVFEVFDGDDGALADQKLATASLFEEALMLYYRQDYQKAEKLFQDCLRQSPDDRAIKVYLERCQANLSL
jgi:predicted ATPase/class 3 adenylate cyclase/tRNA A-37 threonylcarbamoyl transferase component Bud32